jgi:Flp pilus assembly protein TadG
MFCDLGRNIRDGLLRSTTCAGGVNLKETVGRLGFAKDERGNMTMVFGFTLLCAVSFVGMTVDFGRSFATKMAIDRALDQAALAAGRKFDMGGVTYAANAQTVGANANANANSGAQMADAAKKAREYFYRALPKNISARLTSVTVAADGSIKMKAESDMKTMFLGAVGMPTMHIARKVESLAMDANSGGDAMKLEVALVMDVTGSMGSETVATSKISQAKNAAKALIDVLVPPGATSPNARVSVVPFSEYVNAGTYAEAATGVAATTTSTISCTVSQSVCTTVSNVSSSGQYWSNGNGGHWQDDNDGSHGNNGWGNGGDDGHNGSGHGGDDDWDMRSASNNNNNDDDHGNDHGNEHDNEHDNNGNNGNNGNNNSNSNSNSNNGHHNCTRGSTGHGYNSAGYDDDGYDRDGWNASRHDVNGNTGGTGTHQVCTMQYVQTTCPITSYVNTCMAERLNATGHAYDDAAPSTSLFHAFTTTSAASRNCTAPRTAVLPLSSSRTDLYASVDALHAEGSTAGHIGAAWGWYTVSDKWSGFWPVANRPAAADPKKVRKVVVVMTDGEFNTHYDNNYASISEGSSNNATAGNGRSKDQAAQVFANMKAAGIEVFTVGVELGSDTASLNALSGYASAANETVSQHFYSVTSATDSQNGLVAVFRDVATRLAASTGTGNQRTRLTN